MADPRWTQKIREKRIHSTISVYPRYQWIESPGSIVKAVTHFDEDFPWIVEVESPKGRAVLPASAKFNVIGIPSPKIQVL